MARKKKKRKKRRASSTKSRSKATKKKANTQEAEGEKSAEKSSEKDEPKKPETDSKRDPKQKGEKPANKDAKKKTQATLQSSGEIVSSHSVDGGDDFEQRPGVPLVAPPPSGEVVTGIPIENASSDEVTDRHLRLDAEAVWVLQPALRKVQKRSSSPKTNDLAPKAGEIGGEKKQKTKNPSNKDAALSVDFGGESPSVLVDEDYQKMASSLNEGDEERASQTPPDTKGRRQDAGASDPDEEEITQKVERLPMEGEFSQHPNRDNTPLAVPLTKGQASKEAPPGALLIPDLPELNRVQKPHGKSEEQQTSPAPPPGEAEPPEPQGVKKQDRSKQDDVDTAPQKKLGLQNKPPQGVLADPPPPPPPAPWSVPKLKGQDLTRLGDSDRKVTPKKKVDDTGRVLLVHPSPFPVAEDSSKKKGMSPETSPGKPSQKKEPTASGPRLKEFLTRKLDEAPPPS